MCGSCENMISGAAANVDIFDNPTTDGVMSRKTTGKSGDLEIE